MGICKGFFPHQTRKVLTRPWYEMTKFLDMPFTETEVKDAVYRMLVIKSPSACLHYFIKNVGM